MVRYIDFYSVYVMGSVQTLLGFYFLAKLLHKRSGLVLISCLLYAGLA